MDNQTTSSLVIKGIKDGLLITLGEGEWDILQSNLLHAIEEKTSFFHGAKVVLDIGSRLLRATEMGALRDKLSDHGILLTTVISTSEKTEQTAQVLGLGTRVSIPKADRVVRTLDTSLEGEPAIFVQKNMRSGFRVEYYGHVIVKGDVNPGAEILAGGSVIVWGRLRGSVQAGLEGDESATVCALELCPTLLRIAGVSISLHDRKGRAIPEKANLYEGEIKVSVWEK
jgi:septum site-determining protein MinC